MPSVNHSSGRIVTGSPKCELLIPAAAAASSNESDSRCEFCAGERQRRDRERFAKLERVEPIFALVEEDELKDSRVANQNTFLEFGQFF